MSPRARAGGLLAAALCLAGCTTMLNAMDGQDVKAVWRGHDLAQARCSGCHAVAASAKSPNPASPTFGVIARKYRADGLGRELEAIAAVGHYEMPRLPISPQERADIIAYIESLR